MQTKEPLQRVVAGQPISAADWNRIVDRINAGATGTVRAKTPTARVESQIVQVANVGKRDVEFLQPVFSTGTLRFEGSGAALSGFGKLRDQAGAVAALNNTFIVEVDDSGVDKTDEDDVYNRERLALMFVALEPIPVGGVGRALAACGPIFLANVFFGPQDGLGYAIPYSGGTGYFARLLGPPGYAVVARQAGHGRRVALLGYWEQAPALELTYSTISREVVTSAVFEEDVKNGVRPIRAVGFESATSTGIGGEFREESDYDEEFAFYGVASCKYKTVKIIAATRFNHSEYPDSIKIIVADDEYDDSSLRDAGYSVSTSSFSYSDITPIKHRLGYYYGNLIPAYRFSATEEIIPVHGEYKITASRNTRQDVW